MTPIAPGDWFRIAFDPQPVYVRVVERESDTRVVAEFWYHGRLHQESAAERRLRDPDVTPVTAEEGEAGWLLDALTS